ncbi:ABC transporter permease [Rhabdobacter roseus]|uniref:Putative ABC transport system permease protein n=1 Tax=Rhabdobacter roseus TaxID=1655419 RepID=A0A840TZI2_9BACT|nr:ABC transporter permease [Rhabdobacter roseus]MBB5285588.1 putative ABC transport system permease protein [Rhabdobacter roseus]
MLQNYLKIAFRHFRRQAFFSLINVSGLAVGLAACWLIGLYVFHEKNYDTFLPYSDRVCAVAFDIKMGDQEAFTTNTPPPVGARLVEDFPEIEMAARTFNLGSVVVQREAMNGKVPLTFNEYNTAMAADTAFLELFGFPMVAGDPRTALDKPGSVVLTESMARKYFGDQAALGQSLKLNNYPYQVTGIVQELPTNSTVQFGFLASMANFSVVERFSWSWIWLQVDTWVRLRQPATEPTLAALENKFPTMVRTYAPAAYARIGQDLEEQFKKGDRLDVKLLPLEKLHLNYTGLISRLNTLGDGQQVGMFAIIGGLILLLACVNFMNLSTARSMQRAQEVGVRKALGSQRSALVAQFLVESLLLSLAAMLLAALLTSAVLPFYNNLTGLALFPSDLFSPKILGFVTLLPIITGLLGGLYPAFYLSRFKAIEMFKSVGARVRGGLVSVRSGLVVFQFTVSIVLMLGSIVVFRQLEFAQKQSPGLNREHVLVVENVRHLATPSMREDFRQQLASLPEALDATHATFLPSLGSFGDFYEPEQGDEENAVVSSIPIGSYLTDADFVPTLGIEILAGRNFRPHSVSDSASVILNETAVRAIGWKDPIGKWLRYPGNANQRFQVVGVMRDFNDASVRTVIEPMALFHEASKTYQTWGSYMALRLRAGTEKQAVEKIAALWNKAVPEVPFDYDFLDATFARLYRSEARMSTVLNILTGLALFIGCLGLFALAAYTAESRIKEIGVRKVLGASVASIVSLLSTDFLKLVVVAIVIATPIAWYIMNTWLADFTYKIDLEWWYFAGAGGLAVGIALLTISFQAIKAALMNPVESLRSE